MNRLHQPPFCRLLLSLLLLAASLLPLPAQAPPATAAQAVQQAQALVTAKQFDQAVTLLAAGQKAFSQAEDQNALQDALADAQYAWADDLLNHSQFETAVAHYQQAYVLDKDRRPLQAGHDLRRIGAGYLDMSQYAKAIDYYQQALTIFKELKDRDAEASALNNLGIASNHLSQYAKAIDYYQQALPIFREVQDRDGEAKDLGNLGNAYNYLSQYAKAIDDYQQALTIFKELKNRDAEASALNNLGNAYRSLSQYAKAIDYFQQALTIDKDVKDRKGEARNLTNLGVAYASLNQYAKAIDYCQQALTIDKDVKDRNGVASALTNLGNAYLNLNQYAEAIDDYQQALTIHREVKDRNAEADALNNLGVAYRSLSQYAKATDDYQQALSIYREVKDRNGEANALNNLMNAWKSLNAPRLAVFFGKQAVNVYQSIRGDIQTLNQGIQKGYLYSKGHTYRQLADLLITQGRLPEAEQVLAMLKNQEVTDFVQRDASLLPADITVSFEPDEKTAQTRYLLLADPVTRIAQQIETLRNNTTRTPEQNKRIIALQDQLTPALQQFQDFLTNQLPHELAQLNTNTHRFPLQDTQGPLQAALRQMGPGTVALFTLVEPDKYRVILVTSQTQKAEEYPIKQDQLRRLVLEWRHALQNPNIDPRPLGQKLSQILIGPIEEDLIGAKATTLMWSLDDVLRYIPLAALYDGHRYLAQKYRTAVFTGASLPALSQKTADWQAGGPGSGAVLLALGVTKPHTVTDPSGGGTLEFVPLPGVDQELRKIARYAGNPAGALAAERPLEDGQFTQASLRLGLAGGYPVVHIASHFQLGSTYKSSFLLLGDGTVLTLAGLCVQGGQIFQGVDLLTLSACQTGESGSGGGDGREFESLGTLAQEQGASSVLASLWPVSDASTPVLMESFYRARAGVSGMTKAEALRGAQLSLLNGSGRGAGVVRGARSVGVAGVAGSERAFVADPGAPFAHPFYWAPFVLIGNWK